MGNGYCMCTNFLKGSIPPSAETLISQRQYEFQDNDRPIKQKTLTTKKQKNPSPEIKLFTLDSSTFEILLLNEINQVRSNPRYYAAKLSQMLQYITKSSNVHYFSYPDTDIYVIKSGKEIFIKAIDYLNSLNPLPILSWNDDIKITIKNEQIPLTDDKIGYILIDKRDKLRKKYSRCVFNYDFIKNVELSVMFQITDELFDQKRRDAILCPHFKHFAVGYIFDPIRKFVSLLSFA